MKAALAVRYGPPDVLEVKDVEKPVPKDNEVLVRVRASTVNRTDCGILRGKPFVIRLFTGLSRPASPVLGTDFAGVIEDVGTKVSSYKAGDRVFGFDDNGLASHAEYATLREDGPFTLMPEGLAYDLGAASTEGAHYAYNFIRKANIKSGRKVLVNGATGAIGSAAVQLLRYMDMEVTAVCATENIELVRSLGADRVIDYTKEDFTKDTERYDFVFDAVGKSTFARCKPLLRPGGVYVSSELGPGAQNIFYALATPLIGDKRVVFPIPKDCKGSVLYTKKLIEEGRFNAVIDRRYPLEEIAEAYRYVETGQKIGNVVLTI